MITIDLPNTTPDTVDGIATMIVANVLTPSVSFSEEDREFLFNCCYQNLVLAGGTKDWQKDRSAFLFRKELTTDTIVMTLQKEIVGVFTDQLTITDDTYGTFYDFGDLTNADNPTSSRLTGFLLDWDLVLSGLGEGNYRLKIDRDIMGVIDKIFTIDYVLKNYTPGQADQTIVIDWVQNGEILNGLDYTGLNWLNSIRVPGFFGNRQEQKEETLFKNSRYQTSQIRSEITFSYTLEIGLVPQCIISELDNMKQGDTMQVTDFNKKNWDYSLNQIPVKITEIDETTYSERMAHLLMTCEESQQNRIKFSC